MKKVIDRILDLLCLWLGLDCPARRADVDAEESGSGTGTKMKRRVEATLGKLLDQKGIEV